MLSMVGKARRHSSQCTRICLAELGIVIMQDMVPALLNLTLSSFSLETIFTPPELGLIGGVWPSIDELVAWGKRVMFVSGADYGLAMNTVIFSK